MHSPATTLFKKLLGLGMVYVALQVVVGFEVALVILGLHFGLSMPVPSSVATAMPIGLPLLLVQGAAYLAWRSMSYEQGTEQPGLV